MKSHIMILSNNRFCLENLENPFFLYCKEVILIHRAQMKAKINCNSLQWKRLDSGFDNNISKPIFSSVLRN